MCPWNPKRSACRIFCGAVLALFSIFCLCARADDQIILVGAGATFPSPLYRKWIDIYHRATGTRIIYNEHGSAQGIRLLRAQQVDFGATDAFLTDDELATDDNRILHIPTCLGAVAVTYHLPGKPEVRLSGDLVADIFMGRIKRWNAPRIVAENPRLRMPDMEITVVHRSEGSGTTFIFTDFLCKTSMDWLQQMGRGKSIDWAVGVGVEGNPGVSHMLQRIPGGIGYVSLNYAQENRLPSARIKNRHGRYIGPSAVTVSAAAHKELPGHLRVMITDTSAPDGYPISAFTYLIVFAEQGYLDRSRSRAEALSAFLKWIIHPGQQYTRALHYAPLPPRARKLSETVIGQMTHQRRPLWK